MDGSAVLSVANQRIAEQHQVLGFDVGVGFGIDGGRRDQKGAEDLSGGGEAMVEEGGDLILGNVHGLWSVASMMVIRIRSLSLESCALAAGDEGGVTSEAAPLKPV